MEKTQRRNCIRYIRSEEDKVDSGEYEAATE